MFVGFQKNKIPSISSPVLNQPSLFNGLGSCKSLGYSGRLSMDMLTKRRKSWRNEKRAGSCGNTTFACFVWEPWKLALFQLNSLVVCYPDCFSHFFSVFVCFEYYKKLSDSLYQLQMLDCFCRMKKNVIKLVIHVQNKVCTFPETFVQ